MDFTFENVICKMSAILLRPQCVDNNYCPVSAGRNYHSNIVKESTDGPPLIGLID